MGVETVFACGFPENDEGVPERMLAGTRRVISDLVVSAGNPVLLKMTAELAEDRESPESIRGLARAILTSHREHLERAGEIDPVVRNTAPTITTENARLRVGVFELIDDEWQVDTSRELVVALPPRGTIANVGSIRIGSPTETRGFAWSMPGLGQADESREGLGRIDIRVLRHLSAAGEEFVVARDLWQPSSQGADKPPYVKGRGKVGYGSFVLFEAMLDYPERYRGRMQRKICVLPVDEQSDDSPWTKEQWREALLWEFEWLARNIRASVDRLREPGDTPGFTQKRLRAALEFNELFSPRAPGPLLRRVQRERYDESDASLLLAIARLKVGDEQVFEDFGLEEHVQAIRDKHEGPSPSILELFWTSLHKKTSSDRYLGFAMRQLERDQEANASKAKANHHPNVSKTKIHWESMLLLGALLLFVAVRLLWKGRQENEAEHLLVTSAVLVLLGIACACLHYWKLGADAYLDGIGFSMAAVGCFFLGKDIRPKRELRSALLLAMASVCSLASSFAYPSKWLDLASAICGALAIYFFVDLGNALLGRLKANDTTIASPARRTVSRVAELVGVLCLVAFIAGQNVEIRVVGLVGSLILFYAAWKIATDVRSSFRMLFSGCALIPLLGAMAPLDWDTGRRFFLGVDANVYAFFALMFATNILFDLILSTRIRKVYMSTNNLRRFDVRRLRRQAKALQR